MGGNNKYTYDDKLLATGFGGGLYNDKINAPMLNPQLGGQAGFRNKIGGIDEDGRLVISLHNDTKYTSTNLIPMLIQAPKGFEYFEHTQSWYDTLKAMVETRADSITGLKGTLTASFVESDVGGAGEKHSQVINMLRERTEVEFTWRDIVDRPIQNFLYVWMTYLMMDPDTKVPKIHMLSKYATDSYTMEYQTMVVLFIEMDRTHRYVDKAWLVTGMMPKTSGPIEGVRNLNEDATPLDLVIGFTGAAESGESTVLFASEMIKTLPYIHSDSSFRLLGVDSRMVNVDDNESPVGYDEPYNHYLDDKALHTISVNEPKLHRSSFMP